MAAISTIAAVAGIAGSAVSIRNGIRAGRSNPGGTTDAGAAAAAAADPAAAERGRYQDWLRTNFQSLIAPDMESIKKDPAYQFQMGEGINNIDRAASASGLLRSGTRLEDLTKFSSGLASSFAQQKFMNNMGVLDRMSLLGGFSTGSPAAAGQAILQGEQNNVARQNNGWTQVGQGLQVLDRNLPNLRNWFQGGGSNYGTIDPTQAGSDLPY
jgi:hypothetical protein